MLQVLLISDKKNWSYAAICQGVMKFNNNPDIKFKHVSCKGGIDKIKSLRKRFDLYFVLGWQNTKSLPFLDKSRTLVGVHSHQSFDSKKTTPSKDVIPDNTSIRYLSQFLGVNTVSLRLHDIMESVGLENTYTPNGVDTDIFVPKDKPRKWSACCVAAKKNYWNKGVTSFIKPACDIAGFSLMTLGENKTDNKDMPGFYNQAHVYICASLSEGMPMSILEAGACGCVIVSTRCGDITCLVKNGENGFLVDRKIEEIANSLDKVKNGRFNDISKSIRDDIYTDWSWKTNADKWIKFIERFAS